LKYFVLPGGSDLISLIHLARVVTRRCERFIIGFYAQLGQELPEQAYIIQYLNRLSDYFFVLSRFVAQQTEVQEFYWIPRK
jgi:cob(I)alamin adenosyltransferase